MKIWQLFFTIAVCLGCTSVSQARLGQSKTECMKHYTQGGYRLSDDQWYFLTDEGFKKVGKEISANIGGARIERIMFVNKARLNVFVELFKDKVVRVIYEHQVEKLDYQMLSAFLDANKEKGIWGLQQGEKVMSMAQSGNGFNNFPSGEPSVKRSDGGEAWIYGIGHPYVVINSPVFTETVRSILEKAKKDDPQKKQQKKAEEKADKIKALKL